MFDQTIKLQEISTDLIQWAGEGAIITQTPNRSVIRLMRRFVVEIAAPSVLGAETPGDDEPELDVSIAPVTVGYRDSRTFIEDELLPLLERLKDRVGSRRALFSLRVDLPKQNPFYGLYLQQLNLNSVADFKIEIHLPNNSQESRVTVGKKRMTIVSDTLEGFRAAMAAGLAFKVPQG